MTEQLPNTDKCEKQNANEADDYAARGLPPRSVRGVVNCERNLHCRSPLGRARHEVSPRPLELSSESMSTGFEFWLCANHNEQKVKSCIGPRGLPAVSCGG